MSPKLPRLTADALLRALHRDGWYDSRQSGGHVILRHLNKPGRVVVPRHADVTLKVKVVQDALNETGLTVDELEKLL